ncbi:UvrD-helicase domain-containing protein [Salipiger thiooxidans]|uniref:UvrD-helicase domain-containing protein n=1 Tax=Salipiger thiooxidans TaxID=282683 RepID=UPI001CD32886|nr:ATP-dependent helicase [Salipiger thiooxidans]MCA0850233.1 ATP-dependent helicase [Salipiger thiooxidans]
MLVRPEDWRPQGVANLEDRAWDALRETGRSVCVTAGAGAGKTEFLAQKAAYLLQTGLCPYPRRILAISFKRDAAVNLSLRVQQRCTPEQARRFASYTFDAFTKQMLDRFRMAVPAPYMPPANYRIVFPVKGDYQDFFRSAGRPNIDHKRFEAAIANVSLPIDDQDIKEAARLFLRAYWEHQYENFAEVLLTFPMINRLVKYILEVNPEINQALRLSYGAVFLDEFQDTTSAQFSLIRTCFEGAETRLTAVGDDKQKIMGWAGAMDRSFDVFTETFNARRISLLSNWRSHEELVRVQHVIAAKIDPNVELAIARANRRVDGEVVAIWDFKEREAEVRQIARWIRTEVDAGRVAPQDVAILIRMKANDVETELGPALEAEGLILRNLDRRVGEIAIQDLLTEELFETLFPLLRLAASGRNPEAWTDSQARLRILLGLSDEDDAALGRLQRESGVFARELRAYMDEHPPAAATAMEVLNRALSYVGRERLVGAFANYQRPADFERVYQGFLILLTECTAGQAQWSDVLDRLEGLGQVPLMTIHKSKGLEFHTMIFFGLDNRTWWSLNNDGGEEMNSLFVALTRARQRAYFSFCLERGRAFEWLDELLAPVGVQHIDGDLIA